MRPRINCLGAALLVIATISVRLPAQGAPPAGSQRGAGPGQGGRGRGQPEFPAQQRPSGDPAAIARGKTLYEINCRACHGVDLRGGDIGGPNLLRSQLVLNDQAGELIGEVIRNGRQNQGMPPMPPLNLPPDDINAVAAFIHSVAATMKRQGSPPEGAAVVLNILVGNAAAGQAYFAARCSACHSPAGDLQGLATRVPDPVQLQNLWVSGGGGGRGGRGGRGAPPAPGTPNRRQVTVAITLPTGEKVEGRLDRIDDFIVILTPSDGLQRSFRRSGDVPAVEIRDPLEGHRKLLTVYTDKDIHDVTAYLVTVK